MLAELHLHMYGTIRAADLLRHLGARPWVHWDWYEAEMEAAYGSCPPVRELVARHRDGDTGVADEFERLFVFGDDDAGNFDRFQAKFNLLIAGSALVDRDGGPEEIAREVQGFADGIRRDHQRQGITYAEQRFMLGPDLATPSDRAVLDVLLGAYSAGDGTTVERLALSLPRADPWAAWARVQELALGPTGDALTGVDFCFVEEGHPPKDKADFFAAIGDFNEEHPERALAILYHVGESFRDKSLESSVRWVQEAAELGAHRLGHAIALGVDPEAFGAHDRPELVSERLDQIAYDLAHANGLAAAGVRIDAATLDGERRALQARPHDEVLITAYDAARLAEVRRRQDYAMARVRATGAVIEVCPTSNRRIGDIRDAAHHPVHRFLAAGLPVVVSSDDPGIFGTTLAEELAWVCEQTGGGEDLRAELVAASWASRSEVLTGRVHQ